MDQRDRIIGAVVGTVVGDALGVPVEFLSRDELAAKPVTGMRAHGSHNQPAGTWSDDSALSLATIDSLLVDYSLHDMMARFKRWRRDGYMTPHGEVFHIGEVTRQAIDAYEIGGDIFAGGRDDARSNGNGSLMRIMPISLYFHWKKTAKLIQISFDVSRLTHAHARPRLACAYHSVLVKCLMQGASFGESLARSERVIRPVVPADEIDHFARLLDGSLLECDATQISSSGYVMDTLEASVWCCARTRSFEEAVLFAVNLGGDTDTTGAVTGGLAGVMYGVDAIPAKWRRKIVRHDEILDLARRFAGCVAGPAHADVRALAPTRKKK